VVSLDDIALGVATLGLERPDVGNHHPTITGAEAGGFAFRGSRAPTVERAAHGLHLSIRSTAGETTELRQRLRAEPAPAPAAPPPPPKAAAAPAMAPEPSSDAIRLAIDRPALTNGVAREPVRGMLAIAGWALAREGIDRIEVQLDDTPLGIAYYGDRREDVAAAFADWPRAITSGFGLLVPPRLLADGAHVVRVIAIDAAGGRRIARFPITVERAEEQVSAMLLRRRVAQAEIDLHTTTLARLGWSPAFCVAVRLAAGARAVEIAGLGRTLRSLHEQAWPYWQAVVLAPGGVAPARLSDRIAAAEPDLAARVRVLAEAGERPLAALPGLDDADRPGFLCVLRAGDLLGPDALLEAALASGLDRGAELLYGDERRAEPVSGRVAPFFKPDWSPDLLLSTNYIGRPWFAAAGLVARAGLTAPGLRRQGEWDAVLRLAEQAGGIRHIPRLLAERDEAEPDTVAQERAALKRAIARRGIAARVEPGCLPHVHRLRRAVQTTGLVSIIIPTRASRGLVKTTIETIRANTRYPRIEIVAIDNIPETDRRWKRWLHQHADTIVAIDEAFNWSRFNNRAAAAASGEFLLFLNDDIEVRDPEWLDALLEHGQRPEVGVVGPQLLYPDGKVQHAGLFLADTKGRHAFRFADADDPGPFGLARTQRNMIAVTGACFLVSRTNFDALGGFDENHAVVNNDLDFCLRAVGRGLAVVFTPHARLIHHELASRAHLADQFDTSRFDAAWRTRLLLGDPFHSPRLSRDRDDYAPEPEPTQVIHGAHPLLDHASVRRILAVKVDHIGDFVTALPAFRRLKQHFPNAELDVLAASAATSLAALEPAIDRIVEFNFYHARSELGRREVAETELQALAAQLAPARYDIAIDLRKHLDTRAVLQYTGARVLAGFDRAGAAPWLDLAIEWEGDTMCVPKRTHVVDDMLRLVDALALACEPDRGGQPARADAAAQAAARHLPALAAVPPALLARRLVALHPASGNPMRQWPAVRFAELIDLLVRLDDVTVLLIGAPDEAELAEAVLAQASERQAVASLVGRVALRDLPTLLRGCDLYVGNNSGPKHIAAALGVPTVGVHSGVVDAQEWAPVGPAAVAVRREMTCMPCYLEKLESCTRQMACVWGLRAAEVHAACRRMLALAGGR
jgi:ADP-heptose:LPS heptosyltransferase/GT2 family glycosyltransferase